MTTYLIIQVKADKQEVLAQLSNYEDALDHLIYWNQVHKEICYLETLLPEVPQPAVMKFKSNFV